MKIVSIGAGPAGLFFGILMKKAYPDSDIQLYEALTLLKGVNILGPRRAPSAPVQQTAAAEPADAG